MAMTDEEMRQVAGWVKAKVDEAVGELRAEMVVMNQRIDAWGNAVNDSHQWTVDNLSAHDAMISALAERLETEAYKRWLAGQLHDLGVGAREYVKMGAVEDEGDEDDG